MDFAGREITIIRRDEDHAGGAIPGMNIRQLSISEGDALQDELASFIKAVCTRKTPVVSGYAGRKALEVALSIMDQINAAIRRFGNPMPSQRE